MFTQMFNPFVSRFRNAVPNPVHNTGRNPVLAAATVAAAALISGCATAPVTAWPGAQAQTATQTPPKAQTFLAMNENAAASVKQRSFKSYTDVLLVPPKADPRNLAPKVQAELQSLGYRVTVADVNKPTEGAQGTAFVISDDGHLLTCAHVVGSFNHVTLTLNGQRLMADVVRTDKALDLALLRVRGTLPPGTQVLPMRGASQSAPYRLGEDVFTIGFPMARLLGNSARMTKGLLSATAGLRDDPGQVQVSAEIHPGNSGGPLLDKDGKVIGVVQQTINPAKVQQMTGGALPQNINFAIKNQPVQEFVRSASPAVFERMRFGAGPGIDRASQGVAKVQAGTAMPDDQRRQTLVVRMSGYLSSNEAGPRLRSFLLQAQDLDTQDTLFLAGQTVTAPAQAEGPVFDGSMEMLRKAIATR
jgi:serine protease Do